MDRFYPQLGNDGDNPRHPVSSGLFGFLGSGLDGLFLGFLFFVLIGPADQRFATFRLGFRLFFRAGDVDRDGHGDFRMKLQGDGEQAQRLDCLVEDDVAALDRVAQELRLSEG